MIGKVALATWFAASVMMLATVHWSRVPTNTNHAASDCSACHEGSIPLTHSREFIEELHGDSARDDRPLCLGCHDEEDHCEQCHHDTPPDWENDGLRSRLLGSQDRASAGPRWA